MILYIIRHGQSTNNALHKISSRVYDPALTDMGQKQAARVAEHLATAKQTAYRFDDTKEGAIRSTVEGFGISKLYCSAMYRAMLTARPIGKALGLEPEVWVDIHESGGMYLKKEGQEPVGYPGKTRAEILAEFPNYILPERVTEKGWWRVDAGREDWPACQGRAIRVANQLRDRTDSKERIAMVSHGGFMDALIKAITNQLPGEHVFYHHFNTSITRIDFHPNRHRDIRYINRIDHLSREMVT